MDYDYININKVAQAKGLSSNRAIRLEINKPDSKYIYREVNVKGGKSYEILFSSLEPEVQEILIREDNSKNELVPLNYAPVNFVTESARLKALARIDIVKALINYRVKYKTKKEADTNFLYLYNSGTYLPQVFNFIGTISIGTLHRWVKNYEDYGTPEALSPKYKYTRQGEYNSILNDEMKTILLQFLLHQNQFNYNKAIHLTKEVLTRRGYENLPCDLTFKRFAEFYKKNNYAEWVYKRKGEKAFRDEVEHYLERDVSKINVGDILVADGHVLNFLVINPFTGKPTRATLVGFLDWKSGALVGYEIMMTENTQCIASALRNAILNLGMIPKIVYQDNGKAFKSKYFQHTDFDEAGFNGVYTNLNITSVFAQPYNARAKVIERFFKEFQEEFEKMMPSYIGTSIQDKPAWMKRGETLHKLMHQKSTNGYIPTVQDAIKYIDCWLEYHNSKPCPNDRNLTIKECLNSVQKQFIKPEILNNLMMKTETRTINKHGITFLGLHYWNELLLNLRDDVFIRYSLFDLSKIYVYSQKGEFLCVAEQVKKVHPMANYLGTVKDMEEYKQQIQKQKRIKSKIIKDIKKNFPSEEVEILQIEKTASIIEIKEEKPKRERKLTPREQQMNRPFFTSNFEKYEWLIQNGCTNQEDRKFIENFIRSDEYINIYAD